MADALQQVLRLTSGEMPEITTTEKGWHVSWRRDYPDVGWSDERQLTVEHPDANRAFAGIVAWEEVADELEAERGEEGIKAGDAEFWRRLNARIAVLVSGEDAGEQEPSSVSASVDLTEGRR